LTASDDAGFWFGRRKRREGAERESAGIVTVWWKTITAGN